MSISLNGTTGLTFADASSQNTAATGFGFKNRIINGAMMIDQRNAGASVNAANGLYTLDRWVCGGAVANKFTVQQSAIAPTEFINSLICTSSSAYSVPANENYGMQQSIEGFNMSDLGWGTAAAKTLTMSFWVRSSLTGTFGGSFTNSAYDRSYVFSYTISAANTWEQKTVTITGDTSGTWLTNNGAGTRIIFSLGTGSSRRTSAGSWNAGYYSSVTGEQSVVGTNGATFYITGVQLEKGSTATSFDYRPYGTELALCQRYYQSLPANGLTCITGGTNVANGSIYFPVTMRTNPSMSGDTLNRMTNFGFTDYSSTYTFSINSTTTNISSVKYTANSNPWGSTVGIPMAVNDSGGAFKYIYASAEL